MGGSAEAGVPRIGEFMKTLKQIQEAVQALPAEELAAFRAWFAEFDAAEWDKQLEADLEAGNLNWMIDGAR